jgi:hypothetical protein
LEHLRRGDRQLGARPLAPLPRSVAEGPYVEPLTPPPSPWAMFHALDGWTSQFVLDGQAVGGPMDVTTDPRIAWQLARVGGAAGKRVLELGPLEGAHTKLLLDQGAREVVAVEGFRPAWLRCLVVKEIFRLDCARFLYGDFCRYVADYDGEPFDFVLANGVLYHQSNPAQLIHDLARVTGQVLVWSQVADSQHPHGGREIEVSVGDRIYRGRINDYEGARNTFKNYCGGVHAAAVWLYADELRRAFVDAGFCHLREHPCGETPYGPSLLFVASKVPIDQKTCGGRPSSTSRQNAGMPW